MLDRVNILPPSADKKMCRAFQIYIAWTLHGYLGVTLLILISADSSARQDVWFQPDESVLRRQHLAADCLSDFDQETTRLGWNLLKDITAIKSEEPSDEASRLFDNLSSSRDSVAMRAVPRRPLRGRPVKARLPEQSSFGTHGALLKISCYDASPMSSAIQSGQELATNLCLAQHEQVLGADGDNQGRAKRESGGIGGDDRVHGSAYGRFDCIRET